MVDGTNNGTMSDETIAEALRAARERAANAERDRANLERTISAAREEERLLQRLLSLRKGEQPAAEDDPPAEAPVKLAPAAVPTKTTATKAESAHPAVQAVVDELSAGKAPLHISDLMRRLAEKNVQIPGSGTQANLISHLRRDKRLVRPSRGMYALAEWGLEAMPAGKRRRRRRKHRAKAKFTGVPSK